MWIICGNILQFLKITSYFSTLFLNFQPSFFLWLTLSGINPSQSHPIRIRLCSIHVFYSCSYLCSLLLTRILLVFGGVPLCSLVFTRVLLFSVCVHSCSNLCKIVFYLCSTCVHPYSASVHLCSLIFYLRSLVFLCSFMSHLCSLL